MRHRIKLLNYKLQKAVGATLGNVVFIEGGLGSQLLAMMIYVTRQEVAPDVQADVSYFKSRLDKPLDDSRGLTQWPWELDKYGYDLDLFPVVRHRFRRRLSESDQAQVDQQFMSMVAQRDWNQVFPIVKSAAYELERLEIQPEQEFACIHVRRGDYLRVASQIVPFEKTLDVVYALRDLLPRSVVFVSDDPFTSTEVTSASELLNDKQCTFLAGSDQHASHGLMRMASVLITSNSTFSWSAGILSIRPDVMIISPQHFHGPGHEPTNAIFQSASSWMLWSRSGF